MMVRTTKHDAIAPIRQFASAPFVLFDQFFNEIIFNVALKSSIVIYM